MLGVLPGPRKDKTGGTTESLWCSRRLAAGQTIDMLDQRRREVSTGARWNGRLSDRGLTVSIPRWFRLETGIPRPNL